MKENINMIRMTFSGYILKLETSADVYKVITFLNCEKKVDEIKNANRKKNFTIADRIPNMIS